MEEETGALVRTPTYHVFEMSKLTPRATGAQLILPPHCFAVVEAA